MSAVRSVIVVGSSGAGKTTLVNSVRNTEYSEHLTIPKRYITRPPRSNDDLGENSHIDLEAFFQKVTTKEIDPHWQRTFETNRVEHYGFATQPADKRLKVLSANNAFLRDQNPSVLRTLQDGLVVVVSSAESTRRKRLAQRSPDMHAAERSIRIQDTGLDIIAKHTKVEFIDTTRLEPAEGQDAFRRIIERCLEA